MITDAIVHLLFYIGSSITLGLSTKPSKELQRSFDELEEERERLRKKRQERMDETIKRLEQLKNGEK